LGELKLVFKKNLNNFHIKFEYFIRNKDFIANMSAKIKT